MYDYNRYRIDPNVAILSNTFASPFPAGHEQVAEARAAVRRWLETRRLPAARPDG